jgi:hypothetical protein
MRHQRESCGSKANKEAKMKKPVRLGAGTAVPCPNGGPVFHDRRVSLIGHWAPNTRESDPGLPCTMYVHIQQVTGRALIFWR